jgi:hypothetical protein
MGMALWAMRWVGSGTSHGPQPVRDHVSMHRLQQSPAREGPGVGNGWAGGKVGHLSGM